MPQATSTSSGVHSLPRITSEDRRDLLSMFQDVHYVGVGKEAPAVRGAVERLFRKYEASGQYTSLKLTSGTSPKRNAVLVGLVDTFVVTGRDSAAYGPSFSRSREQKIRLQEHYDVAKFERCMPRVPVTGRPADPYTCRRARRRGLCVGPRYLSRQYSAVAAR